MKKINFKKIFSGRNTVITLSILAVVFLFGSFTLAADGSWAGQVVGGIIGVLIRAVGTILILLVGVLMDVAAYSDFIHASAVTNGWIVARDVCNMFFVVILLVIAFATILGQEEYGAKKMLPKLVMAAVLINFSKMFCGIMIDIASVVMLTFVNAFSAIGAGNMLSMLGIDKITTIDPNADVSFGTIVSAYIFGLLYVIIATVVVASMLGMLVMRVIYIWILVVLSPFAFFLEAVPGQGQSYAKQWWSKWSSNLIVGPVLAFFLWLSFASLQSGSPIQTAGNADAENQNLNKELATASSTGMGTEAGTTAGMAKFVIAIGMLLGGMAIAQEVGGATASVLGKGMSALNKGKSMVTGAAMGAAGAVGGFAAGRAKALGNATGRGVRNVALTAVGNMGAKDPITGKRSSAVGNMALQWRDDLIDSRKKTKVADREKFLKKIGMGEKTADAGRTVISNINKNKTVQSVNSAVKGLASNKKYEEKKKYQAAYESNTALKGADDAAVASLRTRIAADPTYTKNKWTKAEQDAVKRTEEYKKNKKIIDKRDGDPALNVTDKAFKSMTEKQKRAKERIQVIGNSPEYFSDQTKKEIYSPKGISEDDARTFEIMNDSVPGDGHGDKALQVLKNQLNGTGVQLSGEQAIAMAKKMAAFEKDPKHSIKALADVKTLLKNFSTGTGALSTNPDDHAGSVLLNYRDLDKSTMAVNSGKGELRTDTFAKNSVKDVLNRDEDKDVMGVSFGQMNARAEKMGVDLALKDNPDVQIGAGNTGKAALVMSSLIGDQISSIEKAVDSRISKILLTDKKDFAKENITEEDVNNANSVLVGQHEITKLQKSLESLESNKPNTIEGIRENEDAKKKVKSEISKEQANVEAGTKALHAQVPGAENLEGLRAAQTRLKNNDLGNGLSLTNTDIVYKNPTRKENGAAINLNDKIQELEAANREESQNSPVLSQIINKIKELEATKANSNDEASIKAVDSEINNLKNNFDEEINNSHPNIVANTKELDKTKAQYDSENRRNQYNGRQHEFIHNAGVTDEELTHESADALQSAQLIGKIPKSDGKRYDKELGAMIANLQTLNVDKGEIKKMIAEKINEWKVPNVQRVVETEQGARDTETDVLKETAAPKEKKSFSSAENNSEEFNQAIEKLNKTVDVLNKSLNKVAKVSNGTQPKAMSMADKNFFRSMFNGLKENNLSGDKAISEAMSPIEAMAVNQENKKSV